MFKSPRRIVYRVSDTEKAKQWYRQVLNAEPVFDSPLGVFFLIGNSGLFLAPNDGSVKKDDSVIVYWAVDDAVSAYKWLLECGATPHTEMVTGFGTRSVAVKDPFGNVVGIMSDVDATRKTVEEKPSDTARGVASLRFLATIDEREEIRGRDYLAEVFLTEETKRSFRNPASRQWMMKKFFPPGMYEYHIARTAYFDRTVEDALKENIPQIIFLGSGYDSRPYRFRELIKETRIFEVDAPATQEHKRSLLHQAGIAIPEHVTFVPTNFTKDSLRDALVGAGFHEGQETLYLWEGVTFYLPAEAVDATLDFIRKNSTSGSSVCFDYYCSFPGMDEAYGVKEWREFKKAHSSGEPIEFGIEKGRIESFLSERGFRLVEHLTAEDMERKYLTLRDGSSAGRVHAIVRIARALVP